ncbi:hypothetical protein [Lacimicrobium alkaliphilum]|uniref:CheW-like domain-containing protein n=1 Tax=Lacimicrobium alkaliphilum TaxID=1526571 RepID=A0ABQ1QWI1_9ALTE|nr:hypothetical protein [Lacimicrobium alkaliphilum]GGD49719.1 hypothetical protein GCM10011357_02060 [Lacimicrobium alkaliphilum]
MPTTRLPEVIAPLVDTLQLVEFEWRGRCVQVPRFAVYAILCQPVFSRDYYHQGRRIGIIQIDPYEIPVLDPFPGKSQQAPQYAVIISHSTGNKFGLFGYPADVVRDNLHLCGEHAAVEHIVKAFC